MALVVLPGVCRLMGAIDIRRVVRLVQLAEIAALEHVGDSVAADAKRRAPIRKVFKERPNTRPRRVPISESMRTQAIARAQAYPYRTDFQRRKAVAHLRYYATVAIPKRDSPNSLKHSRTLRILGTINRNTGRFEPRVDAKQVISRQQARTGYESESLKPLLTGRGRYEVRSGRAIFHAVSDTGAIRVQIGGRLKASIGAEGAVTGDDGTTVKVSARVRYAKFVEFPTVHNSAQPFLLPALHGHRGKLKRELANELRRRLGGQP